MLILNAKNNRIVDKQLKIIATQMLFDGIPQSTIEVFMKAYPIMHDGGAYRAEIAEIAFLSKTIVSKHFKKLMDAGYVVKSRYSRSTKYNLPKQSVIKDQDIRDWATILGIHA